MSISQGTSLNSINTLTIKPLLQCPFPAQNPSIVNCASRNTVFLLPLAQQLLFLIGDTSGPVKFDYTTHPASVPKPLTYPVKK